MSLRPYKVRWAKDPSEEESKKIANSGPRPSRKCCYRMGSAIPRCGPDSTIFINHSHATTRDSVFCCLKQMTTRRSFTTWGVRKNVRQKAFHKLSQSPSILLTLSKYHCLALPVNENGKSFHFKVFWLVPAITRHEQSCSNLCRWE
jgi:hypothetical protein